MEPKPGIQTSEFWLTALTIVASVVLILAGHGKEVVYLGVASGAYTVSRGMAKTRGGGG